MIGHYGKTFPPHLQEGYRMRAIIFFGCFLLVAGSAWAQIREDPWQPASQLHPNPPRSYYGQPPLPSTPESLQNVDAWYQQQRVQQRQQDERSQQEALQHELNQMNRLRTYDRLHWGPLQSH
jgi:pyruvate/2-oxoacid:ferredoxin oxidoreductase alpha subunit